MAIPLLASTIKISRAQKHLSELEKALEEYVQSDPIKFEASVGEPQAVGDPQDGMQRRAVPIKLNFNQRALPDEISAILGDTLHNLRCALDLLATEICRTEDDLDDQTHFPFARREEDFESRLKDTGFLKKASVEALRLMRELKPYPEGNNLLRAIHDLDIRDKHKRLVVNAITFASPIIDLGPNENRYPVPKIIGDPGKPSELKFFFPQDCALAKSELIPTLHQMVELTTGIIEGFKALCTPTG